MLRQSGSDVFDVILATPPPAPNQHPQPDRCHRRTAALAPIDTEKPPQNNPPATAATNNSGPCRTIGTPQPTPIPQVHCTDTHPPQSHTHTQGGTYTEHTHTHRRTPILEIGDQPPPPHPPRNTPNPRKQQPRPRLPPQGGGPGSAAATPRRSPPPNSRGPPPAKPQESTHPKGRATELD